MKVHLDRIGPYGLADTMGDLAAHSRRHQLVDSPDAAELVLLCGAFANDPAYLLDHPLYRSMPERCALYTCEDPYLPLAPGVYASPRRGLSTATGRVRCHGYASSFGLHENAAVASTEPAATAAEKRYLFSFVGSANSALRRRLIARFRDLPAAYVTDSQSSYQHFDVAAPARQQGQRQYVEVLRASHFALCPRGRGTGSLRLFEVMRLGVAPVLLADAYVLPRGPAWESFLVRIPERRMAALPEILSREAPTSGRRGEMARAEWERWFAPDVLFDGVVDAAAEALVAGRWVDWLYRRTTAATVARYRLRLWASQTVHAQLTRLSPPPS